MNLMLPLTFFRDISVWYFSILMLNPVNFSYSFQYVLTSSSETTLNSMFGFGHPLIVLVVQVSQKNFLEIFFPITITLVNRGCLSILCRFLYQSFFPVKLNISKSYRNQRLIQNPVKHLRWSVLRK